MAQTADVTIRLKTLDGHWETCGSARFPNVDPESVGYTHNEWGPETCSFILKRRPGDFHPDLSAFTPCEIEIGGVLVWAGRVKESPSKEGPDAQIAVTGEGMQFHLDDDVYQRMYVHTRLADYVDMRTMPTAGLGAGLLNAAGQVSADTNSIQIGWPKDFVMVPGCTVGVVLDLGPNSKATSAALDWESSNNFGGASLFLRNSIAPDNLQTANVGGWSAGNDDDALVFANNFGASGTNYWGAFAQARRYVQVFLWNGASTVTLGADVFIKIKGLRVFTDTAWDGHGTSVLRASTVVQDALTRATKLITVPDIQPLPYVREILATNGIAQALPLDEAPGAGTTVDLKDTTRTNAINYPGTTLGDPGMLQEAPSDTSFTFSGATSSFVQGALVVTKTSDWSLEVIFKATSLPQTTGTIIHNGNGLSGYGLGISNGAGASGSLLHILHGSVGFTNTTFGLTAGTAYHAILTRDIWGNEYVYVNGALVYSGTPTAPTTPASGGLMLGNHTNSGGGAGAVSVAWAASYTRSLGAGEATVHYQAALSRGAGTIARTEFDIPEFRAGDITTPQTPREVILGVNAMHDYQTKVEGGGFIFRPRPSVPLIEVGAWAGAGFEDASAGSAPDVFSRALVTGTGPDGLPIWIDNDGASLPAGAQLPNGNFDTNTAGWSPAGGWGSLARDTGVFHSGSGSLRMTGAANGQSDAWTGAGIGPVTGIPLVDGREYRVSFWLNIPNGTQIVIQGNSGSRVSVTPSGGPAYPISNWILGNSNSSPPYYIGDGQWHQYFITFVPKSSVGPFQFGLHLQNVAASAVNGYLDDVQILERDPNLVTTRRGFTRTKSLPISTAINTTVAQQVSQIFLNGHTTTPAKGGLHVVGNQGVRNVVGGGNVPAHVLGTYTGELVRLAHVIDPDTGGLGRDGRIASVGYDHNSRTATIAIDNQRQNFEAFIARLAAVTGVATQT